MPIVGAVMGGLGLVTSLFGSIFGGGGKQEAQYAAASLKEQQAEFTYEQAQEQIRREKLETAQVTGQARAAVGASGFWAGGGTMSKYVAAFTQEMNQRIAYSQKIAQQNLNLGKQAADVERQAADAGLWGDIVGGVGQTLSGVGSIFSGLKLGQTAPAPPVGGTDWMSQSPLGGASGT